MRQTPLTPNSKLETEEPHPESSERVGIDDATITFEQVSIAVSAIFPVFSFLCCAAVLISRVREALTRASV